MNSLAHSLLLGNGRRCLHGCARLTLGQPSHATHPNLIASNEVTPRITVQEYRSRRDKLADVISSYDTSKRHVVVVPSHDRSYMAAGVPFIYRQHSNMRYLSGFLENESVLVMEIDNTGHHSTLFVKEHSAHENIWEGQRSGTNGALQLTGVDRTENVKKLETSLIHSAVNEDTLLWYNQTTPVSPSLHSKYLEPLVRRVQPSNIRNADSYIESLRLVKSEAERDLMRKCGDLTSEMFIESMKFSVEHPDEHALFAKFDYECRINGASNLAYLPVIAGGKNALAIHYIRNDQAIASDSMVLVDCGCDLHGYVSDVTRTWPVSGRFTAAQREMYEAVEEICNTCIQFCKAGEYSLDDIYSIMMALTAKQLIRLGVASGSMSDKQLSQLAYQICPHHVGHWLGMDVHDTPSMSRSKKLEPHQVICIEPGMYFGENDERVPKEMRGIGIRVEDNILITEDGYENLTSALPSSANEIEALLNDS
ncbi:XPNPEP3 [Bugula neritina]|uniref:XPNPEP3 n=1 Tax=Bugula neritina TaxID=10212 RepID=A0A7J7ITG5_BUGNE|nr:XPNPEP3 [Bugula neritina]